MKKNSLLFFLLCFLFSNIIVHAQWVKCAGFSSEDVRSLITLEDNIYAGTIDEGIYVSSDNGTSWIRTSLNNLTVWTFAAIGNIIYAGTDGAGVFQSTNNGSSWTQTSLNNKSVLSLATIGDNIFAGTVFNGIYLSTNKGTSWTQTSINNKQVLAMTTLDNNLYAGIAQDGIYMSTNMGTNWVKTSFPGDAWSFTKTDTILFAGAFYGGVYLTTNRGTSWSVVALNGITVYSMAASVNNIFAGTYQSGIYLSENRGTNWHEINQGLPAGITVKAILIKDGIVFAGTEQGVWSRLMSEITGVEIISSDVPVNYFLHQNYPNPFNPVTTIEFYLPHSSFVTLKIFDSLGKEVVILINESKSIGHHRIQFDASDLSSGIYFYRLESEVKFLTKQMLLIK